MPTIANVTKHARERWVERVSNEDPTTVDKQILSALETAEYIWTDKEGKDLYLYANRYVMVVEPLKSAVITVFPADYGFSDDLNAMVADRLLSQVRQARVVLEDQQKCRDIEHDRIRRDKEMLWVRKSQLQSELECVESELRKLDAEESHNDMLLKNAEKSLASVASQLAYSIQYRLEKIAG